MADEDPQATWLPVIGKALANLCLAKAIEQEPNKYDALLKRVSFLEGLASAGFTQRKQRAVPPDPSAC